jgi:hypothetical protein
VKSLIEVTKVIKRNMEKKLIKKKINEEKEAMQTLGGII